MIMSTLDEAMRKETRLRILAQTILKNNLAVYFKSVSAHILSSKNLPGCLSWKRTHIITSGDTVLLVFNMC